MNESENNSPATALLLGFLPSMLALALGLMSGQNGPARPVLWLLCAVSIACCFTSSFFLFRRRTGWAITGGILFLLLNGFISFFAGCVAVVKGMNF